MFRIFHRLTIFKGAKILTERKYDTSDSSSETSSDSDALDFDLEAEKSWRGRFANFITEIHAHDDELLAEEEWLRDYKSNEEENKKEENDRQGRLDATIQVDSL